MSLTFLLLICFSTPLGALNADTLNVPSGQSSFHHEGLLIGLGLTTLPGETNPEPRNTSMTCDLSPKNGTAGVTCPDTTNSASGYQFTLNFGANACGTYTVTLGFPEFSNDSLVYTVVYAESCSNGPSNGTSSSSSGTASSSCPLSPLPPPKKISDDNQVTRPEDSVTLIVQLRDLDGSPMPDAALTFFSRRKQIPGIVESCEGNDRCKRTRPDNAQLQTRRDGQIHRRSLSQRCVRSFCTIYCSR